jgi:probable F420-dependent oxidoreductase
MDSSDDTTTEGVDAWRRRLGRAGVWLPGTARRDRARLEAVGTELEGLGYGALWLGGGSPDREALADLAALLDRSRRLVVASGIANIWAWDPASLHEAAGAIDESHPGRFLLGLGVSHRALVAAYRRPLTAMRDFLDGLDRAAEAAGRRPLFRVIAALRRRMLELARDRSGGAHPYLTSPSHTAIARRVLGEDGLLAPEQAVVLETDPARARATARAHLSRYLALPNYVENLRELGFGDEDLADGGSDRLVDAIVAWGDEEAVAGRVREHLDAGADHVAIQPLGDEPDLGLERLRRLAPAVAAIGGGTA